MKKITLKITAFLFLAMLSFQTNAQAWAGTTGIYKVKVQGEDLFLTINFSNGALTYEAEKPDNDETQKLVFTAHPDGDFFAVTSTNTDAGALQVLDVTVAGPALGFAGNAAGAATPDGSPVQQDKWNPSRGAGTQIFLESDKTGTGYAELGAKRRIQTAELGGEVKLSGGSPVAFDFILLEEILSTKNFNASSLSISNPVSDQLTVKGIGSSITKLSVYNLLGSKVLTKNITGESSVNLSVSNLVSGMYIVKLEGANGAFSKKIIKQ